MRGLSAAVLLECLLSKPVESEGGGGAVEIRSAEAPSAVGAAPAGEVVAVNPDQAFTHTIAFACELNSGAVVAGEYNNTSSAGR